MIDAVRRYDGYVVQSTGDGIFALFGAPRRARGPSAARAVRGAADAGRAASLLNEARRRWRQSAAMPRGREHWRSRGALDRNWRRTYRVHSHRPYHQPRIADAGSRADWIDRGCRTDAQTVRRLLRTQADGTDRESKASVGTGQRVRSHRAGTVAHTLAAFGRPRTDEVRRARRRDGRQSRAPPSRRRSVTDKSSRRWPMPAPASRACTSSSRPRANRAGWCSKPSQSRTAKHRHTCRCSTCSTLLQDHRVTTTLARGERRLPDACWHWIEHSKMRCRICSRCSGLLRAMIRSRRWMGRSGNDARSTRSSASCCASRSISR